MMKLSSSIQTLVDIAEDPGGESSTPQQFSIGDEEDSPTASPSKAAGQQVNATEFHQVSLAEPRRDNITSTPQPSPHPAGKLSRQSSLSSLFSDVSFFPSDSYHPYQFQVKYKHFYTVCCLANENEIFCSRI